MTDWGVPDWTDAAAYGDTKRWTFDRWRWEFTRRREDFREDFAAAVGGTVEYYEDLYSRDLRNGKTGRVLRPGEAGFSARTNAQQYDKYEAALFDPTVTDHRHYLYFNPSLFRSGMVEGEGEPFGECAEMSLPAGSAGIRIDLDRPIEPQLEGYKTLLECAQQKRHGKIVRVKRHPAKWLTYLRVLDGREAGASWRKIFDAVLSAKKAGCADPVNEARNTHKAARKLMFKWPA